jgi:hypothetical protein
MHAHTLVLVLVLAADTLRYYLQQQGRAQEAGDAYTTSTDTALRAKLLRTFVRPRDLANRTASMYKSMVTCGIT